MSEEHIARYVAKGVKFVVYLVAMFVLGGWVTMSLWNWLMPEIFGLTTITWLQAFGLLILSRIFFGSWGKGRGKGKGKWKEGKWRKRWMEKVEQMSPEDRERWKQKMEGRCQSHWKKESFSEPAAEGDPFGADRAS